MVKFGRKVYLGPPGSFGAFAVANHFPSLDATLGLSKASAISAVYSGPKKGPLFPSHPIVA